MAARLQPGARLGNMRSTAVSQACRLAQVPVRSMRQPVRCAADHLQAAVAVATTAPAALAASTTTLPSWPEIRDAIWNLVISVTGIYLGLRLSDLLKEAFQKKEDAENHERLKASLPGLGYHPRLVARLASMPASEFYGAANSKSVHLLLNKWQAAACQDDEEYKELKAQLVGLGCRPRLLARLDSMSASEFFEAANSKSAALLIDKWEAEACEVSMLAAAVLHGALVHFAGWAAG